jgi:hypothetical protein
VEYNVYVFHYWDQLLTCFFNSRFFFVLLMMYSGLKLAMKI